MFKRILIVVPIALALGGSAALAQRDPGPPNPRGEAGPPRNADEAMERERMNRRGPGGMVRQPGWVGEGVIHSLTGNQINMVVAGNQPWRVRMEDNAQLSTKGEVSPALLRPRSVVRFKALLTARDVAVEPITELEVFTPRTGFVSGKEIPTPDEESAGQPEDFAPEADVNDAAEVAKEEHLEKESSPLSRRSPQRTRQRNRNDDDEAATQEFEVTGVVVSFKRGKLLVDAGEGGKIRAELAEDARVKVNLQSLDLAQPGAKIKVSGLAMPNFDGLGGDVVARSVEVTLAPPAPSADPNERPRRRR
jgi:hypothetical protein